MLRRDIVQHKIKILIFYQGNVLLCNHFIVGRHQVLFCSCSDIQVNSYSYYYSSINCKTCVRQTSESLQESKENLTLHQGREVVQASQDFGSSNMYNGLKIEFSMA